MSAMSQDKFAEPMLDGDEFLQEYVAELKGLLEDGSLPDLNVKKKYKVYSIRGSSFGAHKSIVLTADDQRFFTVELGFIIIDGVKRIYPVTQKLSTDAKRNLVYHGEISTTAGDLISKAIATMKKFGNYFKLCNNCQDYCNYYLDAIGLGEEKTLTDGDKVKLVAIAGGLLIILFALLRSDMKT